MEIHKNPNCKKVSGSHILEIAQKRVPTGGLRAEVTLDNG